MAGKGKASEITAPMIQAAQRGLTTITGADTAWMGPGNALQAVVPGAAGRQRDYQVGVNLNVRPRSEESTSFAELRALADAYYLVRMAIETRKDQLVKLRWNIKPLDPKKQPDSRCEELNKFFKNPDKRHDWQDWIRILVEDVMVTDAPCVYFHPTIGKQPYAFEIIDGATIKLLLDTQGRTPLAPDPAYQQNLKGIPAVNYSTDELVYKPRNPRSWKAYGFSPVEQIITIVNIGLRREMSQLQFYTEGNIPEALITTPNTWNPDQIKTYQEYWDALFEGNTGSRRHAKFVPGGMDVHETKSAALTDAFDEWLARVILYAFSLPATAFVKQVNRATADSAKEQAEEEGLGPLMVWIEDFINLLIVKYWGYEDLAFAWEEEKSIDPLIQAQVNQIYLTALDPDGNTVLDANEVRESLGYEAKDFAKLNAERMKEAAKHNPNLDPLTGLPKEVVTSEGGNTLDNAASGKQDDDKAKPPLGKDGAASKHEHSHDLKKKTKFAKLSASNVKRAAKLAGAYKKFFAKIKPDVIAEAVKAYEKKLKKADDTNPAGPIVEDLSVDFSVMLTVTAKSLTGAAREGTDRAVDLLDGRGEAFDAAVIAEGVGDYRAAELVTNLDASTRDMLAGDINRAFVEGWTGDELADVLAENYGFSDARASTISRTEVAAADSQGSMKAYRESQAVTGKQWLLAEEPCPICEENENDGIIDLDEEFSSGDDTAPAHPNCECTVTPIIKDDINEETDNEGE